MAYGHGISVTLVQLARAYTIFATDGELKPVTLLQDRRHRSRPAGDLGRRPRARCAHMLEMAVQPGGTAPQAQVAGLSRRRQDRHRAQARRTAATPTQVRVVVRRLRAGVESAPHRRGDDRRARGRRVLRRRRRRAGVLERDGRRAAHARRAAPTRRVNNVDAAAAGERRAARKRERTRVIAAADSRSAPRPMPLLDRLGASCGVPSAPHHRRTVARGRAGRRVRRVSGHARATAARSSPRRIARGAAAVLWERARLRSGTRAGRVPQPRRRGPAATRVGAIADFIYGSPSRTLWMAGVTGTNGKTSCAQWIAQALDARGPPRRGDRHARQRPRRRARAGARTPRPTPRVLQRAARAAPAPPARARVAMEVSSHGLDQGRVNGVDVRRRALHQPHARPSRLPRDDGGVRRGQGAALRVAGPARRGDQRRRRVRPQPRSTRARARGQRVHHLRRSATADVARRRRVDATGDAASRSTCRRRGARGDAARRALVGAFNAQNLLGVLGALLASDVAARRRARGARARSSRAAGPHAAPGRRRRSRSSSSTTRTRPTRSRRCSPRCARPSRAAASSSACSAAAAIAIRGKRPQMGAVAGAPRRPRRRHQRQPAQRGSARDRRRQSSQGIRDAGDRRLRRSSSTARGDRARRIAQARRPATSC